MKVLFTLLFWHLVIFCSLLAPVRNAFGQTPEYYIEHFTSENGLPQNSVKSIAQCADGYIWLSTEGGLVRFDGRNFKVFTRHEMPVGSNRMRHFVRGKRTGDIFAISEQEQLIRIDGARPRVLSEYKKPYVTFRTAGNKTVNAYSSTGMPSIFRSDVPAGVAYHLPLNKGNSFVADHDSVRYMAGKQERWTRAYPNKDYWQFFTLGQQLFYLGRDNEVTLVEKDSTQTVSLKGDILANSAYITGESARLFWNAVSDNVFLYLNKSLYLLETRPEKIINTRLLVSGFDFDLNSIYSLHYSKDNDRLFLGSQTKGLFVIRRRSFQTLFSGQPGTGNETYYTHIAFPDNNLLTDRGFLFGVDGFLERLPVVAAYSDGYSMVTDSAGTIWTKKQDSVYRLSADGKKLTGKFHVPGRVTQVSVGPGGDIWVGTAGKGVYKLDTVDGLNQVLETTKEVTYLSQGADSSLWVGTRNGLYRLSFPGMKVDSLNGLDSVYVRSIYLSGLSGSEEVWVTTAESGFFLYKDQRLTHFPMDKEAYLASSHCILEDAGGYFWISTNRGLFQAAKQDLLAFANGDLSEVYYAYYGKEAGFSTNEFNGGCQPCGVIRENRYFSFPSLNGLVQFQPGNLRPELPLNDIHIDEIEIDSARFIVKDSIILSGRFDRMQIYFSTPYFGNPYNLNFKYRLKGLRGAGEWLEVNDHPVISFSSLPSGTYHLTIRKKTGFHAFSYNDKRLVIIVPPVFYETWWFRAAIVALLILIILLYIRFRLKAIKRRNDELEMHIVERTVKLRQTILSQQASKDKLRRQNYLQQRLLAAITHDIKSPLQYLALAAKTLSEQQPAGEERLKDDLGKIYRSSSRIFYVTENLVQYMKVTMASSKLEYEPVRPFEIVRNKIEIFNEIAELRKNRLENSIDKRLSVRTNKQLLAIVIHNLLDNAIKFTRCGSIRFSARTVEDGLKIIVEDTGTGMDPELVKWCNTSGSKDQTQASGVPHKGLGLTIVKELLAMIDGKLHVSRTDCGTRFEITL